MAYKVTCKLAVVPNDDGVSGDGYFYQGRTIPDGWNDERCEQLAEDGLLKKVKAEKPADPAPAPDSVEGILAGVGDDKGKAAAALKAEEAKGDKARKTLVDPLKAILGKA